MVISMDLQRMDMKLSMPHNPCSIPFSLSQYLCSLQLTKSSPSSSLSCQHVQDHHFLQSCKIIYFEREIVQSDLLVEVTWNHKELCFKYLQGWSFLRFSGLLPFGCTTVMGIFGGGRSLRIFCWNLIHFKSLMLLKLVLLLLIARPWLAVMDFLLLHPGLRASAPSQQSEHWIWILTQLQRQRQQSLPCQGEQKQQWAGTGLWAELWRGDKSGSMLGCPEKSLCHPMLSHPAQALLLLLCHW